MCRKRGRTKPGCGRRHGLYEFTLIHMVLFTLAPGAATHCVICRVVCKDLPPGSHERPSYIRFHPALFQNPACRCPADDRDRAEHHLDHVRGY